MAAYRQFSPYSPQTRYQTLEGRINPQNYPQNYPQEQRPDVSSLADLIAGYTSGDAFGGLSGLFGGGGGSGLAASTPVGSALGGGTLTAGGEVLPFTSGFAEAGGAPSMLGQYAGPAAFLATAPIWAPILSQVGNKVGKKAFGRDDLKRPFNAEEIASARKLSSKGKSTDILGGQISGFRDKPDQERVDLVNKLNDLGALSIAGGGKKDEAGNVVTKDRGLEFINYQKLQNPSQFSYRKRAGEKRDTSNPWDVPTEDQIRKNYKIPAAQRQKVLDVLKLAQGAATNSTPTPRQIFDPSKIDPLFNQQRK